MRYWIGVASKEHVSLGVQGGFCQLGHGKVQPLRRMSAGDLIVYYSPKETLNGNVTCQHFTAIGEVADSEIYQFEVLPEFIPYRRNVNFFDAHSVSIRPLIEQLSFIADKSNWGYVFRFGHFEIPKSDFDVIASAMMRRVP